MDRELCHHFRPISEFCQNCTEPDQFDDKPQLVSVDGSKRILVPTLKEYDLQGNYITKDSGEREQFSTGMQRDTQSNKPRYDLLDKAMLKRWAELMARGAVKYGEENWRLASTEKELKRFQSSAIRHMYQWLNGETDEDHAAAVFFNVSGAEMVKDKLVSSKNLLRQG